MNNCSPVCPLNNDNAFDIAIAEIKNKIIEFCNTEEAKILIMDNKINELCLYIKNNLEKELVKFINTMKSTGELDEIITTAVNEQIKILTVKTDSIVSPLQFGAVPVNGCCYNYDNTEALKLALNSGKIVDLGGMSFYHKGEIDANNVKAVINGELIGNTIHFNCENLSLYNVVFNAEHKYNAVTVWNNNISIVNCKFINVESLDNIPYALNLRKCQNVIVRGCIFRDINGIGTRAARAIRLEDTKHVTISECTFDKLNGVEDSDYIHVYSLDNETYTTITNNIFYVNNCKSAIKVQSSKVNIYSNSFICCAESPRIYALVRIQNGKNHIVENNYFYAEQKNNSSFPALMMLCEYCDNVYVNNNTFDHNIKTGYNENTGANIIKITECTNTVISNNVFTWELMYRLLYLTQNTGDAPIIKNNRFEGKGCCIVFEEKTGGYIFEGNTVNLINKGGYLCPIYSNGSATVINNDITFNEYSVINTALNLVCKGNVFRNNNENTVIDVIRIGTGSSFIRDNTYDGYVRYQISGNPSSLMFESICDQSTGTPINITDMSKVQYFNSRYKCNKLDFGNSLPTYTPRETQQFYNISTNKLMVYYNGNWTEV